MSLTGLSSSGPRALPLGRRPVPHWPPGQSGGTFTLPLSSSVGARRGPGASPPQGGAPGTLGVGWPASLPVQGSGFPSRWDVGASGAGVRFLWTCPRRAPPLTQGQRVVFKVFCGRFNSKTQAAFLFIMHKKSKSFFFLSNLELEALENLQKYTNASP